MTLPQRTEKRVSYITEKHLEGLTKRPNYPRPEKIPHICLQDSKSDNFFPFFQRKIIQLMRDPCLLFSQAVCVTPPTSSFRMCGSFVEKRALASQSSENLDNRGPSWRACGIRVSYGHIGQISTENDWRS